MNRPAWLLVAVALFLVAAASAQEYPVLPRWETTNVDAQPSRSGFDAHLALALDSDDRPHIAYFDANTGALAYAHLAAGPGGDVWRYDVIDSGDVGRYVALDLDSASRPYVSYYDSAGDALKVAFLDGGLWTVETVAAGGNYASLVVGPDDQPRVSYSVESQLYYAYRAGGAWQTEAVNLPGFLWVVGTSLALDSSGVAHIAYYLGDNPTGHLRLATRAGADDWAIEAVAEGGIPNSPRALALDSSGRPVIVFHVAAPISIKPLHVDYRLMLASRSAAGWDTEELIYKTNPNGWVFGFTTLSAAFDSLDKLHVAAVSEIEPQVYTFYRSDDQWRRELVGGNAPGQIAYAAALAVGSDDQPRLGFNESDRLLYARRSELVLDQQVFLPFTLYNPPP